MLTLLLLLLLQLLLAFSQNTMLADKCSCSGHCLHQQASQRSSINYAARPYAAQGSHQPKQHCLTQQQLLYSGQLPHTLLCGLCGADAPDLCPCILNLFDLLAQSSTQAAAAGSERYSKRQALAMTATGSSSGRLLSCACAAEAAAAAAADWTLQVPAGRGSAVPWCGRGPLFVWEWVHCRENATKLL